MSLEPSTGAWLLLGACTVLVSGFLLRAYLSKRKQKVPLFYCWLGAIAVLGGAAAFFLPIAVNSGFAKDDDGSALRQALLYTTGGLLAVITLGETHRKNNQEKEKNENDHIRQVYAERRSRYTKAIEQLADEKAAVRLGGIYTLVGLVDEWLADKTLEQEEQQKEGQVIINNLCSYIRAPFPLAEEIEEYEARKELEKLQKSESEKLSEEESSRLQILLKRFEDSDEYEKPKDITTDYAKFHEEQDVRRTIFVEMSKRSSAVSVDESKKVTVKSGAWSGFKFDFSRAPIFYPLNNLTIEQGQFSSARFYGNTNFIFAKFTGDADFTDVEFSGNADFRSVKFAGNVDFESAGFIGYADFMGAGFAGYADFVGAGFIGKAYFLDAEFTGDADFESAGFSRNANFSNAEFTGDADFGKAKFTGNAYFSNVEFSGNAHFREAKFTGNADFRSAEFSGNAQFWGTDFTGNADFTDVKFTSNTGFKGVYFEKYAPIFVYDSGAARFSNQVNWADSNFSVRSGSKPIELGSATLGDKTFSIPFGTVVFDPGSWDEKTEEYTHMSVTCCRIRRSPHHQE